MPQEMEKGQDLEFQSTLYKENQLEDYKVISISFMLNSEIFVVFPIKNYSVTQYQLVALNAIQYNFTFFVSFYKKMCTGLPMTKCNVEISLGQGSSLLASPPDYILIAKICVCFYSCSSFSLHYKLFQSILTCTKCGINPKCSKIIIA